MTPTFCTYFTRILGLLAVCFAFNACTNNQTNSPDVSHIKVDLKVNRFEQELFKADSSNYEAHFEKMAQKYPKFFNLYVQEIMEITSAKDTSNLSKKALWHFVSNANIKALNDSCQLLYSNFETIGKEFEMAFKRYKYYFPNRKQIPEIFTHVSEFGPAAATLDSSLIAVSLDMYLGKNFVYYPSLGIPNYVMKHLETPYIVPNSLKAFLTSLFGLTNKTNRLVDRMVYEGKILYVLDLLLPKVPNEIKMNYTKEQLNWCEQNENQIWRYFIDKDLLFSTKSREYMKLLTDGPTTTGMPTKSPGKVGAWVGWQIVKSYMKQFPNTTMDDLMQLNDGQMVLTKSKYKP
jgi:gliding motility-associated lipoprotein GldB